MTLADSAPAALAITAACAVVALFTRVLTTSGVVAAFLVGACVSAGFGLPGLAVLGTFFVVGTAATRIGWEKKKARGTAEAGEGRRDWKRVVGKGGVAAVIAVLAAFGDEHSYFRFVVCFVFAGAVAAALADTLGTEIGTLAKTEPRSLPTLRRVATGTPGAVSRVGLVAAAGGGFLVGAVWAVSFIPWAHDGAAIVWFGLVLATMGLLASVAEAVAVGVGLRAPGFARNVLTTLVGAGLSALYILATSGTGRP